MGTIEPDEITQQLERLSPYFGKSDLHRRLLAYLVERGLRGDVPKELDIAIDVFGKDAQFNSAEDATVRGNVRAVRQRLDEYYRGPGNAESLRIEIPKGGYRVHFAKISAATPVVTSGESPRPEKSTTPSDRSHWVFLILGVATVAMAVIVAGLVATRPAGLQTQSLRDRSPWAQLNSSTRPLTIVLGDLFMYSELDSNSQLLRQVRDPTVTSRDALRRKIAASPELARQIGSDTTVLPKSVAFGLASVLPVLDNTSRPIKVVIADELDVNDLRELDIVYIGPLMRLGPIGDLYWPKSQFRYALEKMQLSDLTSEQTYRSTGNAPINREDFGLFARFDGPTGNQIIILTSVATDIGLLQTTRGMTSIPTLAAVNERLHAIQPVGDVSEFEVLFSANGIGRKDLQAEIVTARPLLKKGVTTPKAAPAIESSAH